MRKIHRFIPKNISYSLLQKRRIPMSTLPSASTPKTSFPSPPAPSPPQPQIDLRRGWPNPSLLLPPTTLLQSGAHPLLTSHSLSTPALLYGADAGDAKLRRDLARWNAEFYRLSSITRSLSSSTPLLETTLTPSSSSPPSKQHRLEPVPTEPNPSKPNSTKPAPAPATENIDNETTTITDSAEIAASRYAITSGASQALACILQVYSDPAATRAVWFVEPAYMLAFRVFEDAGLARGVFRGVREDGEGVDVGWLRGAMQAVDGEGGRIKSLKPVRSWAKHYRHIIYAVPTFANPSSKVMTLRRRQQLLRLAREHDALVITDDVYDQLQWTASTTARDKNDTALTYDFPTNDEAREQTYCKHALQPRLVDIDATLDGGSDRPGADGYGNAVSNGSFSKLCGPGLRTGWVEGTAKFAFGFSLAGSNRSGGAASHFTATLLAELLERNVIQEHVTHVLRPAYSRRYHRLVRAIERDLVPLGAAVEGPVARVPVTSSMTPALTKHEVEDEMKKEIEVEKEKEEEKDQAIFGGYFIWLRLPPGISADDVADRALEEENLIVARGGVFMVPRDDGVDERIGKVGDAKEDEENDVRNGVDGRSGKGDTLRVRRDGDFSGYLRLCFAWEDEDLLEVGIWRLKGVVERFRA